MPEPLQDERRWTPADQLEMKLDRALAERDRLAEVARELAEALRFYEESSNWWKEGPDAISQLDLDHGARARRLLARYEALRDG